MSGKRPYLLAVDVDRIQAYVFESARLPEVRGASALLSALGDAAEALLPDPEALCYQAGGALLGCLEATPCEAEALRRKLEAHFANGTGQAASATAVALPCGSHPRDDDAEFGLRRDEAARLLRDRKLRKETMPLALAAGLLTCTSCDQRPADGGTVPDPDGGEPRWICQACALKRGEKKLQETYLARLRAASGHGEAAGWARTLEEIAVDGLIGMVLLDGDGMGGLFRGLGWDSTRKLSAALREALPGAVFATLGGLVSTDVRERPEGGEESYFRAQVLYIGGDDLLLIVPGAQALRAAADLSAAFSAQIAPLLEDIPELRGAPPPTLSGGVVIARSHYPVYFLHELAQQLCHSAKAGRTLSAGRAEGWLDFLVLRSSSAAASSLPQLREQMTGFDGRDLWQLHDRPYPLGELCGLLALAESLSQGGKGPLVRLHQALRQGPLQSAAYLLYAAAQGGEAFQGALLGWVEQARERCLAGHPAPPAWHSRPTGASRPVLASRLADAVDLYGLTGGDAHGDGADPA